MAVLAALVRNRFGSSPSQVSCPFAAAVDDGERLAVLLADAEDDESVQRRQFGLGAILAWAGEVDRGIEIVAPVDRAPTLARHAESFERVTVSVIDHTSLAPAPVAPLPVVPVLTSAVDAHRELFESVGAVPVDDFGYLVAEVVGLEIARAHGKTGQLSVGVGTADRELHGHVHTEMPPGEALRRAADLVRSIRRPRAPGHPLNRRGRQRWLRSVVHAEPALVGAVRLDLLPPLAPRLLQLGPEPAAALDIATSTVYVFTAGVDLEAVPAATDYRRRHRAARTVLVLPERDALPPLVALADAAGLDTWTLPALF